MENTASRDLQEYLTRTNTLLADIKQWSVQVGLRVVEVEVAIAEERHGQYQAPKLVLYDHNGKRIAEITPFGESILGARGRVDIVGEYGKQEKIVYLAEGGPSITTHTEAGAGVEEKTQKLYRGVGNEGWYWVSPSPIRRAYPVTQEIFSDLLSAVTGYVF